VDGVKGCCREQRKECKEAERLAIAEMSEGKDAPAQLVADQEIEALIEVDDRVE